MTEIAFHFNAPDKLAYACRFARKALRSEASLVITAPAAVLEALDRALWAMGPQDFVAHCRQEDDAELREASPVVLAQDPRAAGPADVLLNLGASVPAGFERFGRLVEVVSSVDEADRAGARDRWRHYTQRGYAIVRHDLVLKGG
ncbi:DNA polymerase III subunit chi [Acidovorax sp. NCPPB 4044]|uniref:DNA polymerase III subunit chi n=1 Tax=Acidovorax sp. NCPPB 4044 TaxID=2940490 RepID=UPI00230427D4|nr:DNA polymerase III subunit chi [Acidovorax sp. NCPPB 4044]MDA8520680.1 DNA polymerase III subunit chi [Acidovorax sp. NCPPB 4044]